MNIKYGLIMVLSLLSTGLFSVDFGSAGAMDQKTFDLDNMLRYAWEDEHMALAEYKAIMDEFNVSRPYSNIARSEETHIAYLTDIYKTYDLSAPSVDVKGHLILPESLEEAAEIGVQAEINNIAMYELFLREDLPADVADVFEKLKSASENHLATFQRQLENPAGRGRWRS